MSVETATAFLVQAVSALIAITNPIGAVPFFLAITEGEPPQSVRRQTWQAVGFVTAILLATVFAGRAVLEAFGLSLHAFRAGGGLVILLMGLEMLRGERTRVQHPPADRSQEPQDTILVPFAMPMVAGPGAIATTMTLASTVSGVVGYALLSLAIVATSATLAVALFAAPSVHRLLGSRGQRILLRFMGLILLTLGTQFLLGGARDFLLAPPS